jgi:hypothetical protein
MAVVKYGTISADVKNPHFLITNNHGDYLALGAPNHSNYDGYFVKRNGYYKILANIDAGETRELNVHDTIQRVTRNSTEELSLHHRGLLMRGEGSYVITLDCKKMYDESDSGRIYDVTLVAGDVSFINVHYKKFSDASLANLAYEFFVTIATTMRVEEKKQWREVEYPYDQQRGTHHTPWVFHLCMLTGKGSAGIAYGETAETAKENALHALHEKKSSRATPTLAPLPLLAWRSLAQLETQHGIFAGLPWFFQEWSRDELISCGGLLEARDYMKVIAILEKWYGIVREDGSLPAIFPDQGLTSSDAPGWLGKRTRDLLVRLGDEGLLYRIHDKLDRWRETTGKMIDAVTLRDGLLWNAANTTWMDTESNDGGRHGARIEIQALFLTLYDAHAHLCTLTKTLVEKSRTAKAHAVHETLITRFKVNGKLIDGLWPDGTPDLSIRPNIFLACYIAPKLFTNDEWKTFFSAVLPELWLPWGGLSSIGKSDRHFHAKYTGEDVASYHRGDSWYFVNNIAAVVMNTIDAKEFSTYIHAIREASMRDFLEQGFCGHASELSSAEKQEAAGCHAQAWSASTLLELLRHT